MRKRRIGANYILWPGFPLLKNGYLLLDGRRVTDIVDTGGIVREIEGLEFYGGMLLPAGVLALSFERPEDGLLLPFWEELYTRMSGEEEGVALLKGADLRELCFRPGWTLERLV